MQQPQLLGMTFTFPSTLKKKGKWYIACCLPLDVYSQGETEQKATENLGDALVEFILSCLERGTLDEVLRKAGFVPSLAPAAARMRMPRNTRPVQIAVPFVLQDRPQHALHC
jgi:predicted RNase H-like HicB family nuclease